MSTRRIAITDQSAWLYEHNDLGEGDFAEYVVARASFGTHMPTDRNYEGLVTSPKGIRVGERFFIQTEGGLVSAGVVNRIVNADEHPRPVVPEGFIDVTPSWRGLGPVLADYAFRKELQLVCRSADILVALKAMGLVTDNDIERALAYADAS